MIYQSAIISLFIQFITGGIDVWGLNIPVPKEKEIYKDLLKVELGVQTVEFIFYLWMTYNFNKINNITPYRYLDWLITTPIMLITLIAYLDTKTSHLNLHSFISENKMFIIELVSLNLAMLIFGLLGELKIINYTTGILLGFIPFVIYFYRIYDKYITEKTTTDRVSLYWFFAIVWTLYGVAALMPYDTKNTMYNILDLFAKNTFGIFLVYVLWNNRIKSDTMEA
jgi:bacteriorhodopsin